MPGPEPVRALGRGSCALHGEVEGPRDTKGRARCPVPTCRRILAVRGSRGAPSTKGLATLPDRQALEDPDIQKLRKLLAVAELRRKTYEVDRSLVWEARAPELDRRLEGVEDQLRQLAARQQERERGLPSLPRRINELDRLLKELRTVADDDPLVGDRSRFKCPGCGATRFYAVEVVCTMCQVGSKKVGFWPHPNKP